MDTSNFYPLQLLDVRLYDAAIKRMEPKESIVEETTPTEETEGNTPSLGVNIKVLRHAKRRVSVFLTLDIKGPTSESPEFNLHYTLEGFFEARMDFEDIAEETWTEFEHASSLALLWPYAREYTQSFVRRMRVMLPILPTFNRLALQNAAVSTSEQIDKA